MRASATGGRRIDGRHHSDADPPFGQPAQGDLSSSSHRVWVERSGEEGEVTLSIYQSSRTAKGKFNNTSHLLGVRFF